MTDNFAKYKINLQSQLPSKVDLSKVKILWSKSKEEEELEKAKQEELQRKRESERKRLGKLADELFNNKALPIFDR